MAHSAQTLRNQEPIARFEAVELHQNQLPIGAELAVIGAAGLAALLITGVDRG